MVTIVMNKSNRFDRRIKVRNAIECVAAVAVAPVFVLAAWQTQNLLMRAGYTVVVASCAWILFYMLRYGGVMRGPEPDQSQADFQRALLRKYEYQIRLLKNVKYWYLLPMYVGLVMVDAGRISSHVSEGTASWADATGPVIYTAVFAVIWWLNEVSAVGRLRRERDQLLMMTDGSEIKGRTL